MRDCALLLFTPVDLLLLPLRFDLPVLAVVLLASISEAVNQAGRRQRYPLTTSATDSELYAIHPSSIIHFTSAVRFVYSLGNNQRSIDSIMELLGWGQSKSTLIALDGAEQNKLSKKARNRACGKINCCFAVSLAG